jgi:hypothetical protein
MYSKQPGITDRGEQLDELQLLQRKKLEDELRELVTSHQIRV